MKSQYYKGNLLEVANYEPWDAVYDEVRHLCVVVLYLDEDYVDALEMPNVNDPLEEESSTDCVTLQAVVVAYISFRDVHGRSPDDLLYSS